tara:strand:- start:46 stop:519 length:474 start_codon:yes stop_codon:yes gene_type:complete
MYTLEKTTDVTESALLSTYTANPTYVDELSEQDTQAATEQELTQAILGTNKPFDILKISITEDSSSSVAGYIGTACLGALGVTRMNTSNVSFKVVIESLVGLLKAEGVTNWKVIVKPDTTLATDAEASFDRTDLLTKTSVDTFKDGSALKFYNFTIT